LPAGSAYETAAQAYRHGATLRDVAAKLGCNKKAAGQFVRRLEETVRPNWCREVFRDADGRHLDLTAFAETLRALRQLRGWGRRVACARGRPGTWKPRARGTPDKLTRGLGVRREDLGVTWGPLP
jgi:hypothetical protein